MNPSLNRTELEETLESFTVRVSSDAYPVYTQNCSENLSSPAGCEGVSDLDPYASRITSGVFYILVFMSGTILNGYIICCVVVCSELRRKWANVLLLLLCLSNLVQCLLIAPVSSLFVLHPAWHLPHSACLVLGTISTSFILVSMWTVLAINLDKYQTIMSPLSYSTYTTTRRLVLFLLSVSTFILITVCIIHVLGPNFTYSQVTGACTLDFSVSHGVNIAALVLLSANFIFPTMILFFFYVRIFQIARSHRKRIVNLFHKIAIQVQAPLSSGHIRRPSSLIDVYAILGDTKAVCTISLIIGSFVVCYLPFGIVSFYEVIARRPVHPCLLLVASVLFRLCPVVNALVYGAHNKILRTSTLAYHLQALRNKLEHSSSKITFQEAGVRQQPEAQVSRPVFVIADSADEAEG